MAAQHVDADLVVHYGHACLSPTSRLPVIHVFPKLPLSAQEAAKALLIQVQQLLKESAEEQKPKALLLLYDVGYAHASAQVHQLLSNLLESQGVKVPLVNSTLEAEANAGAASSSSREQKEAPAAAESGCCSGADKKDAGACGTASTCCKDTPTNGSSSTSAAPPSNGASQAPTSSSEAERLAGPISGAGAGRRYTLPTGVELADCAVLYLGGESLALTNLLLRLGPSARVITYDPQRTCSPSRREDGATNRLLMRRYVAVQKARDATVIGLLVGTLGVSSYLPLLSHLRQRLQARNRRVYTISVGKLTPAKLANFQEIDAFVLLACPENSLVDAVDSQRSREYYRPIVSPFEMLHALREEHEGGREWSGAYELDLERLLPQDAQGEELPRQAEKLSVARIKGASTTQLDEEEEESDEEPVFSLITGGYVSRPRRAERPGQALPPSSSTALATAAQREQAGTVSIRAADGTLTQVMHSAGAAHLQGRSWRGLEERPGDAPPSVLRDGRVGTASGYANPVGTQGKEGEGVAFKRLEK